MKEGTQNLTRNFQRYTSEEDTVINNLTKKMTVYFNSVSALPGYKNFSLEELRRLDIISIKKKGNLNSNGASNFLNNAKFNNQVNFNC